MSDDIKDIDLDEAKGTGVDSMAADPVTPAGGAVKKRKADLNATDDQAKMDDVEDDVKTPQGKNDTGLKESIEGLFEGMDLSEDFVINATAIFEGAVQSKVNEIEESLQAQYEERLSEDVSHLTEKLDSYLDYVAKSWLEENKLAVESGVKVEMAESLFDGIKDLMNAHNLDLDEEKIDVNNKLQEEIDSLYEKYNETVSNILEVNEENEKLKKQIILNDVSEGLTVSQKEKLISISEGLSYAELEEFEKKVVSVKNKFVAENINTPKTINEEVEEVENDESDKTVVSEDPIVNRYAQAMNALR